MSAGYDFCGDEWGSHRMERRKQGRKLCKAGDRRMLPVFSSGHQSRPGLDRVGYAWHRAPTGILSLASVLFVWPLNCTHSVCSHIEAIVPDTYKMSLYHWRAGGTEPCTYSGVASHHQGCCLEEMCGLVFEVLGKCKGVCKAWDPGVCCLEGWWEDGVWLICFNALTLQKLKLSDEPVEAKEDYTKFNTKDLKTGKVCVLRCGGMRAAPAAACSQGWLHRWLHLYFWPGKVTNLHF